jgi:1,4-dihydroxy-2-naphthoate octaprenyltransferase
MCRGGVARLVTEGAVRRILVDHLVRGREGDPNGLVPAPVLRAELERIERQGGETALRAEAEAYARLWARTFKTLVGHLRGRPERALALFVEEVYPFLRGDRLAARIQSSGPGRATLELQGGLPGAYQAALAAAFVGLSGAHVESSAPHPNRVDLSWRTAPADRLVRLAHRAAAWRFTLILAAVASCLLGVALAARAGARIEAWRVAAVLVGGFAAQLGANAVHDVRDPKPASPLDLATSGQARARRQAVLAYAVASGCGLALAVSAPVVVAFAAVGLALSALFGPLRNRGWGPAIAAAIYGPLMAAGAFHAFVPLAADWTASAIRFALTLPLGLLAATNLVLDDLADRPLDEAGGARTLLVRLPQRAHLVVLVALSAAAVGSAWLAAWLLAPRQGWVILTVGVPWVVLLQAARTELANPRGLAPARVAGLVLHGVAGVVLVLAAARVLA